MPDGRKRVVILYSHPLLGEGLARLLAVDPELLVCLVHVDDLEQAEQALAGSPDVVIVERIPPVHAIDLLRLAPEALLIEMGLDAGSTWSYRRDELASQPEDLLRAIHGRDGSHPAAAEASNVLAGPAAAPTPAVPVAAPSSTGPAGVVRPATSLRSVGA